MTSATPTCPVCGHDSMRAVAVVRGTMDKAIVLLGSATPSLESWYNAVSGRYTMLRLPNRATARRGVWRLAGKVNARNLRRFVTKPY